MMAMPASDLPTKSRDEYKQLAHIGRGAYGDVSATRDREEMALMLVLVLEHADAGDLEQYLRVRSDVPVHEAQARQLFRQIARGVSFLHTQHVVHRDLKSSNVFLFQSGRAVLGDFGTSKRLLQAAGSDAEAGDVSLTSTLVGSPLYMSPELLESEPHGLATDIWSLGCVLYELLSGGGPAFAAPSYPAVVFRVTQGTYDPLDANLVSSEALELVANMLQKTPQQRPTIEQVLRSPWLQPEDQGEGPEEVTAQCLEALPSHEAALDEGSKHEPDASMLPPPAPTAAAPTHLLLPQLHGYQSPSYRNLLSTNLASDSAVFQRLAATNMLFFHQSRYQHKANCALYM
ncbi:hypothetical protein BBJ28_00011425 [Nothophytophthora sp. Chile5]|nr:hypothetical protein BBJ28_00011425 [Nothophytophthora sp. Chile5]